MIHRLPVRLLGVVLALIHGLPLRAQPPLTLRAALARADRSAYANRSAAGQTAMRAGAAVAPLGGVLPSMRVAGGYTRTTDPLAAFGFLLQQRGVTPASFDPAALNRPAPIGDVSTGVVLEQPILNVDAWLGRQAADRARDAASAGELWTRSATAWETIRAYYGAVLATERVGALTTALAAARAQARQADALFSNGSVTRSDVLLASVRADQLASDLAAGQRDAVLARLSLALAMGTPADTAWSLPAGLPPAAAVRALAERAASDTARASERADVRAAMFGRAAAEADVSRARARFIPSVSALGRLDWNTPTSPFGGRESWTVGVMITWSPLGAAEWSDVAAAAGRRTVAAADAEAAIARAVFDRQEADLALVTALDRLTTAERALSQSSEAARIVSRKYDGGLATIAELLEAAAVETQSRLALAETRYRVVIAVADQRHAAGQDFTVLLDEDLTP